MLGRLTPDVKAEPFLWLCSHQQFVTGLCLKKPSLRLSDGNFKKPLNLAQHLIVLDVTYCSYSQAYYFPLQTRCSLQDLKLTQYGPFFNAFPEVVEHILQISSSIHFTLLEERV